MFSIFPPLLAYQNLAPVLLRITIGIVFILWASKKFKAKETSKVRTMALLEGVIGISFILGFLTQLAALISIIILGIRLIDKIKTKAFLTDGVNYYLILFVIALTLLITGPGFISIDLPL